MSVSGTIIVSCDGLDCGQEVTGSNEWDTRARAEGYGWFCGVASSDRDFCPKHRDERATQAEKAGTDEH